MSRVRAARQKWHGMRAIVSGLLALVLACVAQACTSDLSESLEGKSCSTANECLSGYVCNAKKMCVRVGTDTEPQAGSGAGGSGAGGSGNVAYIGFCGAPKVSSNCE